MSNPRYKCSTRSTATVPRSSCIIDDYLIKASRKAVSDYRGMISAEIVDIDGSGVLWRK